MPDDTAAPLSTASTRLWLPQASLTACVRGVVSRSTLGVVLPDMQRFNHFPATPLCTISWLLAGESEYLEPGAPARLDSPRRSLPSRLFFGGPQTGPTTSWNPGPAHGMMLLLMPDALKLMTGIDPGAWLNRLVDAAEVLPADWLALCQQVLAEGGDHRGDDNRVARLQAFIDPRWQAARPATALAGQRHQDWALGLAQRAATSAPGRSLRQVERRIKHWAGQPMRELMGMGRAERAFFETLAARNEGRLNWADVAADSGYADQSHFCRATRRITGFSPDELRRRIAEDEGFWAYRVWQ